MSNLTIKNSHPVFGQSALFQTAGFTHQMAGDISLARISYPKMTLSSIIAC